MRIERLVSVIRLYEHDEEYEEKRKWLCKYGELLSVHDRYTASDGCFLVVEDAVVEAFLRRWPEP